MAVRGPLICSRVTWSQADVEAPLRDITIQGVRPVDRKRPEAEGPAPVPALQQAPLRVQGPATGGPLRLSRLRTLNAIRVLTVGPAATVCSRSSIATPTARPGHQGRFFKAPDDEDFAVRRKTERRCAALRAEYVPGRRDIVPATKPTGSAAGVQPLPGRCSTTGSSLGRSCQLP